MSWCFVVFANSTKLFRKLTTKPVWWWERRRMNVLRGQWRALPPVVSDSRKMPVALLTTPAGFEDAIWSAWSWLTHAGEFASVRLYVDGVLDPDQRAIWQRMFPGSEFVEAIRSMSGAAGLEKLQRFILGHPMGRKLMLPLVLQKKGSFIYSDSDVVLFQKPRAIADFAIGVNGNAYIQDEGEGNFDAWVFDKVCSQNLSYAKALNGGLFLISQNSLDACLAGELLEDWQPDNQSWFTEQAVMSVLMEKAGAGPLSRDQYVVSNRRQFYWEQDVNYDVICLRHFTGTTRHVLYCKAIKHIFPVRRIQNSC